MLLNEEQMATFNIDYSKKAPITLKEQSFEREHELFLNKLKENMIVNEGSEEVRCLETLQKESGRGSEVPSEEHQSSKNQKTPHQQHS